MDAIAKALQKRDKIGVLFVCLGNICRSPAAEGVMKAIVMKAGMGQRFEIDSAGTGRYHIGQLPDQRMRVHARRRGLELDHRCRQVTVSDFDDFDLIIGMDGSNMAYLRRMAPSPEAEEKVLAMSEFVDIADGYYDHIPDPYYEGSEGFELVLDLLQNGCQNLFNILIKRSEC